MSHGRDQIDTAQFSFLHATLSFTAKVYSDPSTTCTVIFFTDTKLTDPLTPEDKRDKLLSRRALAVLSFLLISVVPPGVGCFVVVLASCNEKVKILKPRKLQEASPQKLRQRKRRSRYSQQNSFLKVSDFNVQNFTDK